MFVAFIFVILIKGDLSQPFALFVDKWQNYCIVTLLNNLLNKYIRIVINK